MALAGSPGLGGRERYGGTLVQQARGEEGARSGLMQRHWLLLIMLFTGAIARAQTPVRHALPVPDVPGFKTLKADFHLHTVFSDGTVWPTVHVQDAWRDGLDVIALTEHAEYTPHAADVKVDIGRSYVIWNHPRYRVSRAIWFPPIARAFDAGLFQGMELVNGPDFYDEAYPWIAE